MKNNNNKTIYLIIFSAVILIIYNLYTNPAILCDDGETLYSLKDSLILEQYRLRVCIVTEEFYIDTYKNLIRQPLSQRSAEQEMRYLNHALEMVKDARSSLDKIYSFERRIIALEPNFITSIQTYNFNRVWR